MTLNCLIIVNYELKIQFEKVKTGVFIMNDMVGGQKNSQGLNP